MDVAVCSYFGRSLTDGEISTLVAKRVRIALVKLFPVPRIQIVALVVDSGNGGGRAGVEVFLEEIAVGRAGDRRLSQRAGVTVFLPNVGEEVIPAGGAGNLANFVLRLSGLANLARGLPSLNRVGSKPARDAAINWRARIGELTNATRGARGRSDVGPLSRGAIVAFDQTCVFASVFSSWAGDTDVNVNSGLCPSGIVLSIWAAIALAATPHVFSIPEVRLGVPAVILVLPRRTSRAITVGVAIAKLSNDTSRTAIRRILPKRAAAAAARSGVPARSTAHGTSRAGKIRPLRVEVLSATQAQIRALVERGVSPWWHHIRGVVREGLGRAIQPRQASAAVNQVLAVPARLAAAQNPQHQVERPAVRVGVLPVRADRARVRLVRHRHGSERAGGAARRSGSGELSWGARWAAVGGCAHVLYLFVGVCV